MTLHRSKEPYAELCPIRDVLDRLGNRWTLLILWELEGGTLRFSELKSRIKDISQRMLAQTLRLLEQDGLVSREVFPTIPPRVEYTLTPMGHSLLGPVRLMIEWAKQHQEAVHAARAAYVPPKTHAAK
jgi:DNA-binding HxlR family transcriptional regulator